MTHNTNKEAHTETPDKSAHKHTLRLDTNIQTYSNAYVSMEINTTY